MTDSSRSREKEAASDVAVLPGAPRWVRLFGIVGLVLVALFVVLHLTGNSLGGHPQPDHEVLTGNQRP
jgi:hypothetical protein